MHQVAGRGVVNILTNRHQPRTSLLDRNIYSHVVKPVAGQAVNLVDYYVLDAAFGQAGEHGLELRAGAGFGRFSGIDELGGYEEALNAYLASHIPNAAGLIRVNKHYITVVGDFKIEVYPKDHRPAHFHAVSRQRNINARIDLHTLELVDMKKGEISNSDLKLIKKFFQVNQKYLKRMRKEAIRLEVDGAIARNKQQNL